MMHFCKGRAHYFRCTPSEYAKAVSYFKKAVELDQNYGQAYAALALTYWESSPQFLDILSGGGMVGGSRFVGKVSANGNA